MTFWTKIEALADLFQYIEVKPFVYRILIRLGACLALWQLLRRPFHWNKTEHGLCRWPWRGSSIR